MGTDADAGALAAAESPPRMARKPEPTRLKHASRASCTVDEHSVSRYTTKYQNMMWASQSTQYILEGTEKEVVSQGQRNR